MAAKVRGRGPLGRARGGDRHRVAGGAQQNDPSSTASKEEETLETARSDGVGAEKDAVVETTGTGKGGIVDHTRKRVAVPT